MTDLDPTRYYTDADFEKRSEAEFSVPNGEEKVLLHSCCAPCAGPLIERMHNSGVKLTILFYNPNIHPRKEYEIRKNENRRFAEKLGIECIDLDYDADEWFKRAKGMEHDPERGRRCSMCFDMRFVRTALYAHENNFNVITSSLGISRWKNMEQINDSGVRAADPYDDVSYWTFNWRKDGGAERMYKLAKEEEFYQQQYCGCIYSLRDTNEWRTSKGRDKIAVGETWYKKHLEEFSR